MTEASTLRRALIVTIALLAGVLLAACQDGSDKDAGGDPVDREAEERGFLAARTEVSEQMSTIVEQLEDRLPGMMKFNQGNHDTCSSDLDGAVAYAYSINGRIDLLGGAGPGALRTVVAVLEEAGLSVDDAGAAFPVTGTQESLQVSVSMIEEEDAILFAGTDDRCWELGRELADDYGRTQQDPLG